jgi:Glycosyl transferase family 2
MSAALSVVILTPDRFGTISKTLTHLAVQNVAAQLEIVIVAPSARELELNETNLRDFHSFVVVETGPVVSTANARAAGVRAASSAIVAFAEDHSFPAPGWAEALIARHREDWAAVGPAMANANPRSLTSWANLLIEYSEWLDPSPSGEREHLPGHNSSYKRSLLLEYGDQLAQMLDAESILHWDLRRKRHRLYLEGLARTFHENFSRPLPCIPLRFNGGRLFAAARSRGWPVWRRALFVLASPIIPLLRFVRITRELFPSGRPRHLLPRIGPALLAGLVVDGAGELFGYALGPGNAMARLSDMEFHRERYVDERDEARATAPEPDTAFAR